jgi:hypothetical protein
MMILLITVTVSWLVAFNLVNVRDDVARSVVYALGVDRPNVEPVTQGHSAGRRTGPNFLGVAGADTARTVGHHPGSG